jgi:hypothetical protein
MLVRKLCQQLTTFKHTLPSERARRMLRAGRAADQNFDQREPLFRRYCLEHWVAGKLVDAHFSFPPSLNRGKYSFPEDVICSEDKAFDGWGVLDFRVGDIPKQLVDGSGRTYLFFPFHEPDETNYSHTVIQCEREDSRGQATSPNSVVKKRFRAKLSQQINIKIEARV